MEKRGEKIAGSRYIRDFCVGCGTPMRVLELLPVVANPDLSLGPWCERCAPHRGPQKAEALTPRQCAGLQRTNS